MRSLFSFDFFMKRVSPLSPHLLGTPLIQPRKLLTYSELIRLPKQYYYGPTNQSF